MFAIIRHGRYCRPFGSVDDGVYNAVALSDKEHYVFATEAVAHRQAVAWRFNDTSGYEVRKKT